MHFSTSALLKQSKKCHMHNLNKHQKLFPCTLQGNFNKNEKEIKLILILFYILK